MKLNKKKQFILIAGIIFAMLIIASFYMFKNWSTPSIILVYAIVLVVFELIAMAIKKQAKK